MHYQKNFKRLFDIIISLVGIFISVPIIFLFFIIIIGDGGPALFFHNRIGFKGVKFKVIKLRTMFVDAEEKLNELLNQDQQIREEWFKKYKLSDDPRETKIGKFLRKSKLDELPQFINVLSGKMSLVGPRPLTQEEFELYFSEEEQIKYLSIKPGITGNWAVNGSTNYSERIKLELEYIDNISFKKDFEIIILTFVSVLFKKQSNELN